MIATCKCPEVNQLIAELPTRERDDLLNHCELIELTSGEVLSARQVSYSHAWFPLTAFISVKAAVSEHPAMEVGMIGHEGMLGVTLLLAVDQAPHQAMITGPGKALRISREELQELLQGCPELLLGLQHYCFQLMEQMTQTAICTHFHRVEERLARWLLMTHDRSQGDDLYLTHQLLANLLGVRRSAVTLASGILKKNGLIGYSRGRIRILDRQGLEEAACECYGTLPP
ncbi:Crp/Fnr family transcriptional regulator [Marinospirillum sp.]|uniref:Crp/Fnr family transcriptional regulator n=1 Tax=Marinospirillum sp. TaxID=2183934 RepID=UPI0038510B3F